ncbi:protein FANTASTIC FOUR 3-like [Juglans microcarpa x Juglans regia]|uniref:protein FANTASTIC FOUR 3-like n=1 Tax=Juglans microcarpa x Juglans regia TaxID=2249226 RepID=UPI001B7F1529|nr:protein FANTASTIC FOUR 3-like [Juglans microcarpa x Juglans regia]
MATIVYQGLQSCLDSTHLVEPKTVRLKLSSPTPHFSQPLELALRSCFLDCKTKEVGEKYHRIEEVCNKPQNPLDKHSPSNPDLGGWSFLQAMSINPEGPKEAMEKENIYVHPLDKRSSSILSEKSLELCTENLGNETGTEIKEGSIFSLPASDSKGGNLPTREQRKSRQLFGAKKINPRNFPPPLTTISGSESLRVRPHREDGRLIIKAVKAPVTHTYFQAERSHGRLRLCVLKTCTLSVDSDEADNEENEAFDGKEGFDSDTKEEKQPAVEEEEEEEEEEDQEEEDFEDGEKDVYLVGEDLDGNYAYGEAEMGKEKFERPRGCKEDDQHEKKILLDWEPVLWPVATS